MIADDPQHQATVPATSVIETVDNSLEPLGWYTRERDGEAYRVRVTHLGQAVRRWRPWINVRNAPVLGRYAARALAACQLRNPTREGRRYGAHVRVFPFAFIWRAMLALDGTITSDELNRAILRTENENDLEAAVERIKAARQAEDLDLLGDEVVTEGAKNDRILVLDGLGIVRVDADR